MTFNTLSQLIDRSRGGSLQFEDANGKLVTKKFVFNEPATVGAFDDLVEAGLLIPTEFRCLLELSNGFEIYNYQGLDGYKIYGTKELVKINNLIRDSYDGQWDDGLVIGAECIGDGTYLGFKAMTDDEACVVDCFLEADIIEWKVVSPSISKFISRLIEVNGKKFWLGQTDKL